MKDILYLECYHGISGDMTVGALLDLGADPDVLTQALASLPITGFHIQIGRVKKAGLDACDFQVTLDGPYENHDHDMAYLHPEHTEGPHHAHDGKDHTHDHTHNHHYHHEHTYTHHEHRGLEDVLSIIRQSDIKETAKQTSEKIFTILGGAEAKAHGTTLKDVHFHEVGAIDSIVDIVAVAVCLDNLGISDVVIPMLYEGCGTIRCQHGILPVPVPAVTNILQAHQLPLQLTGVQGEFVTPTGAAIAAAIRTTGQLPHSFQIIRTGIGAGKRTYTRPSMLRAMLIRPAGRQIPTDTIYKLETNVDDCTGEALGYTMECLMRAGALDVHYSPVYMKKNRPAYQLDVVCKEEDIPHLEQIIFLQTTTIGIRRQQMERSILPREIKTIQTDYGEIRAKLCKLNNETRIYPEYDSLVQISQQTGIPYPDLYVKVQDICQKTLS